MVEKIPPSFPPHGASWAQKYGVRRFDGDYLNISRKSLVRDLKRMLSVPWDVIDDDQVRPLIEQLETRLANARLTLARSKGRPTGKRIET